jgi:hypothetical protein
MRRFGLVVLAWGLLVAGVQASDQRIIGSWRTTTYQIQGVDHPMDGIMIFTPSYFAANIIVKRPGDSPEDANANSGPYWAEDGKIVFAQWMQLHYRPEDPEESFLRSGIDEPSTYRFESQNKLILQFPSGNFYVLDRLPDSAFSAGADGLWAYRTLQSANRPAVELDGLFLLHQGYFLQQSVNRGRPEQRFGQGHVGTFRDGREAIQLSATTGIIVDPSSTTPFSSRNNTEHEIHRERTGDTLKFTFGTGTIQVFDRVPLAGPVEIHWLEGGGLGLADKYFILVVDSGQRQISASGTFTRNGNRLTLQGDRWIDVDQGKVTFREGQRVEASIEQDGILLGGRKIAFRR